MVRFERAEEGKEESPPEVLTGTYSADDRFCPVLSSADKEDSLEEYASVCPSDEDSQAFVINAANGDFLKLKAADAKERQFWVDRIRAVAEFHSDQAEHHPTIATLPDPQDKDSHLSVPIPASTASPLHSPCSGSNVTRPQPRNTPVRKSGSTNKAAHPNQVHPGTVCNEQRTFLLPSSDALAPELDSFPVFCSGCSAGPHAQLCELFRRLESETQALVNAVDTLLLSKATSQATLSCLKRCMDLIRGRVSHADNPGSLLWLLFVLSYSPYPICISFLNSITRGEDPEARMMAFVQWYLTAFHAGRKDKIAKKPYNPIIGESFHCCWLLPPPSNCRPVDAKTVTNVSATTSETEQLIITYHAEQVSHHPPVTAFYFECPAHRMELTSSVHAKSKFQGMSVSVTMVGKTVLRLGEHNNEEYHFTLPTAYARSILTVPWVELGDKVNIQCPQTGYSANVVFLTKPMRGNKLHRISAEVYAPQPNGGTVPERNTVPSNLVGRVTGEWNSVLEFEWLTKDGKKWSVDVNTLPINRKCVRPTELQRPEESRRLWQHVTNALRSGDVQLATEKKREVYISAYTFVVLMSPHLSVDTRSHPQITPQYPVSVQIALPRFSGFGVTGTVITRILSQPSRLHSSHKYGKATGTQLLSDGWV
ncbi:hypothetical protein AHF37_01613 [Paragonimus kellicotti]|nr:hypothetical protein AHF37_01613 [Paragonimus kellicotti]